jgi:predicted lipoprotein with Yx(FWY)xxD motif
MRLRSRIALSVAAVGVAAGSLVVGFSQGASASPRSTPRVLTAGVISLPEGTFGNVLAKRNKFTLYLLTDEVGVHYHCTNANGCFKFWKPLLVTKGQTVSIGSGVKGKVTLAARSATTEQVVFNSYPVYTFVGDSGPAEHNGEGLNTPWGLWYMLRATALTPAGTPVT